MGYFLNTCIFCENYVKCFWSKNTFTNYNISFPKFVKRLLILNFLFKGIFIYKQLPILILYNLLDFPVFIGPKKLWKHFDIEIFMI